VGTHIGACRQLCVTVLEPIDAAKSTVSAQKGALATEPKGTAITHCRHGTALKSLQLSNRYELKGCPRVFPRCLPEYAEYRSSTQLRWLQLAL
jgi:hypothetical protein